LDTENDRVDTSKIEPTKAEAEAIARGLQVFIPSYSKPLCSYIAFCLEVFYGLYFPTRIRFDGWLIIFQTIRNDDLEEIRELGSGTYGAVYHGKWKGSDVAIKRIKASCFSGRPSERARLVILISDSFSFCLRNC
jgi:hypothetical protein